MLKIIPINDNCLEQINELQRAEYEVTARENILRLMVNNNQKQSIYYKEIWNEYIEQLKQYVNIKNKFYILYVEDIAKNLKANKWGIDFNRKELILNV